MSAPLLVVGEIFVDFTLTPANAENKLRLGGIAHAVRGLWAIDAPFAVAAVCPRYLQDKAAAYLAEFGCEEFIFLGEVSGAPNVMIIGDSIEVGDQGYENILRDEKSVALIDVSQALSRFTDVLVFPGAFDIASVYQMLRENVNLHIDIAYDVGSVTDLSNVAQAIKTILISTSSDLFLNLDGDRFESLRADLAPLSPTTIILKENRGGARITQANDGTIVAIPAILGSTINSVGVGDVFSAAFVTFLTEGPLAAGLKATRVSSAYAQTTFPDVFARDVKRALKLTTEQMDELGGVSLPWDDRTNYQIYLAAPDFSYEDRRAIDRAFSSLRYHNFVVRRPVQENGELPANSDIGSVTQTYHRDVDLLAECDLVFAVPTNRDAGTLVEVGLAIQMNKPVIVYDPYDECRNTMIIAGADCYSQSMDTCLNEVFTTLSNLRAGKI